MIFDGRSEPGHAVDEFSREKAVAVEFQIHARNFRTPKYPDGIKDYAFRLQSLQLVAGDKPDVSAPRTSCTAGNGYMNKQSTTSQDYVGSDADNYRGWCTE